EEEPVADRVLLDKGPDGVASLVFNRPDQLNAFDGALQDECLAALAEVRDDDGVRVVVLSVAGRAFSAGFDLSGGDDEADVPALDRWTFGHERSFRFTRAFWDLPKPV